MTNLLQTAIMFACGSAVILALIVLVSVVVVIGRLVWRDVTDGSHLDVVERF